MNAKWMRKICVSACLPLWSASLALPSYGSPALELLFSTTMLGQVSVDEPLGRDDVDRLLRQARNAIQNGNFDQADAILRRTERVAVHYPFLHMGPTPSSVRRELQKAQRSVPAAERSSGSQATDRAGAGSAHGLTGADGSVVDPFLRREASLGAPAAELSTPTPDAHAGAPLGDGFGLMLPGESSGRSGTRDLPEAPRPSEVSLPVPQDAASGLTLSQRSGATRASLAAGKQGAPSEATEKQQVLGLLADARKAMDAGDVNRAEQLVRQASALAVPESQFLPDEDRPSRLAWEIVQAKNARQSSEPTASDLPTAADGRYGAQPASVYVEDGGESDGVVAATSGALWEAEPRLALTPEPLDLPDEPSNGPRGTADANRLAPPAALDPSAIVEEAEAALRESDRNAALELYRQAHLLREGLDAATRQQVENQLQALSIDVENPDNRSSTSNPAGSNAPRFAAAPSASIAPERLPSAGDDDPLGASPTLLETAGESEQILARQLSSEVGKLQSDVRRLRESEPQKALEMLREMRERVEESQLPEELRQQLVRRLDLTIRDTEKYYEDNRHQIELDQQNAAVRADVERSREVKLKVQQRIAELVEKYNRLKDEQRFAEAQVVAQQLRDLAPDEQVTQQIWLDAKFVRRTVMNRDLMDRKEDAFWNALNDVENSAVQEVGDGRELIYGTEWESLARRRRSRHDNRRSERDLEIERRLKTPVLLKYQDAPLSEVVDGLSTLSGVNIHLDPRGLSQEGIHSDTPVTIHLSQEISLRSALNLILEPLHLSYVIKDEVLKITSEQLRDGELVTVTYNVADLVIPIPNFVPNNNIGLQGLINDAYDSMSPGKFGAPGPAVMVGQRRAQRGGMGAGDPNVLAQRFNAPGGAMPMQNSSVPIGSGPGGMGGGANADFDSLIDLIVSTVSTETWAEHGGGEAEIRPFPTNLSLVISQTQAVHEEIADLLAQLRRLVDLQVTIEVRFIRLNDSFFERIGIDFQMNAIDRGLIGATPVRGGVDVPGVPVQSGTVGLQPPAFPSGLFPNFTADLDIPFRQGHFAATAPAFGGFDPANAATFGFAILSDIEAFFLIEAAQGDRRTNVLNAPKVTLFNGQQAFVADAVSRPFVIGVIPVVGEFAAAQQPVIVVLNEGTMMTIQAVVSDDRRYVRLTVVPFFTQVGEVREFTFEGTTSTTSSSSTTRDDDDDTTSESQDEGVTRSGVTVQLPAFQFVSVVTTVSVPDGGTVLLGGIKRLSEGRDELGVPLLSKIPYVNRLFKNVGIGRTTESLMMMVTPRIIIQEEEEERLGIAVP